METVLSKLQSVLCDPEGKCCISGSDADRAIVDEALAALATQPPAIPAAPAVQASGEREHAENYRLIRRGQHWSVIDGMGNTLRGDDLDAAVDAIRANRAALASPPASGEKQG